MPCFLSVSFIGGSFLSQPRSSRSRRLESPLNFQQRPGLPRVRDEARLHILRGDPRHRTVRPVLRTGLRWGAAAFPGAEVAKCYVVPALGQFVLTAMLERG